MVTKIVRTIIIFLVILIISDQLAGRFLRRYYFSMKSGVNAKIAYIVDRTDAELLVFGSSAASHNYNTILLEDKLGIKSYNAGRDGTGLLYSYGLLKMVLERHKPKIVILDFHPASLNKNYTDNERIAPLLPYYQHHKEIRDIILQRSKFEQVKLLSKIYPYNSLIWDIIRYQKDDPGKEFIKNKGYLPLSGKIKAGLIPPPQEKMIVGKEKVDLLMNFVKLAKSNGVNVILVLPPEYVRRHIYPMDTIRNICYGSGAEVYDFTNDSALINTSDFYYDYVHLNHYGADVLSRQLADSVLINQRVKQQD